MSIILIAVYDDASWGSCLICFRLRPVPDGKYDDKCDDTTHLFLAPPTVIDLVSGDPFICMASRDFYLSLVLFTLPQIHS